MNLPTSHFVVAVYPSATFPGPPMGNHWGENHPPLAGVMGRQQDGLIRAVLVPGELRLQNRRKVLDIKYGTGSP